MVKIFVIASVGLITALIIIGANAIYIIESPYENATIKTELDAYWWTIATVTAIGYGDVVPVTDEGKILGMVYSFFALLIIGILVVALREIIFTKGRKRLKGFNPSIENVIERLEELEKLRKEDYEKILKLIQSLKDKQEENSKN